MSVREIGKEAARESRGVPLMTVPEVAQLLRTTRKAIYTLVEREQLPGVVRLGRRVLVNGDVLIDFLRQSSTPSERYPR